MTISMSHAARAGDWHRRGREPSIEVEGLQPVARGQATVVAAGQLHLVPELSSSGLCLDTAGELLPGDSTAVELRLAGPDGVEVHHAVLNRVWTDARLGRSGWAFSDPEPGMLAAIGAYRGRFGDAPDAAGGQRGAGVPTPPRRSRVKWILLGSTAALLAIVAGFSAFETFFVIQSSFAAVTAPGIELRAVDEGELVLNGVVPGATVTVGQIIGRISNPALEHDLEIETTRLDSSRTLVEQLTAAVAGAPASTSVPEDGVQPVAAVDFSSLPRVPGSSYRVQVLADVAPVLGDVFDGFSMRGPVPDRAGLSTEAVTLDTRRRIDELNSALDVQERKVSALNAAVDALSLRSPCDCRVYAVDVGTGDSWIGRGDKIADLVPSDTSDVRIEARIPARLVDSVRPGQEVRIDLPDGQPSVAGTVVAVVLDGEPIPRVGFPEWIRQDRAEVSVIVAPAGPIPAEMIGTAVKTRIFLEPSLRLFSEIFSALGIGNRASTEPSGAVTAAPTP
jgi:hypothetical protein